MAKSRLSAAGGFAALFYVLKKSREAGGLFKLSKRMFSKNACKTCALGMGGQKGGMTNEAGHFPEVCKKSFQAQAGDMAGAITEEFFKRNSIAQLSRLSPRELEELGRLAFPIIAEPGDTHYRRASWDEVIEKSATAMKKASPDKVFFYSSGRASNEAAFLMQLVARAYGTRNIHNCSFYCHQASGVALNNIYGSGTASINVEDIQKADLILIAGANPASNHPRLMTQLMHLRRKGGKVIMVNPLKELGLTRFRIPSDPISLLFGSKMNDIYLQPNIGSDIALYKALLKGVMERGDVNKEYVAKFTTGWDEVKADIEAESWDALLASCGVSKAQIDETVDTLVNAKRGIFMWAMGLTHHTHGVDNIQSLANIALAKGWLGQPGCGLLPIRGHSNVQGVGTVGVAPTIKEAFAEKLEQLYRITIPREPGQDTYASMCAALEGNIDVSVQVGGNLYGSNPDSTWAKQALQSIPVTVALTTKLNEGHTHGRGQTMMILPVLARDEEAQPTTQESMFNFVRLSDGGKPAVEGEMRSEVDLIATLAERILPATPELDWSRLRSHDALRQAMAETVAGLGEIKDIGETKHEFFIPGRTLHTPQFNTPDGKAHFAVTPLPKFAPAPGEFRLMTLRSEGQFNSVVYEDEDLYRGIKHRHVVMMAEADTHTLGIREGDWVHVKTDAGEMRVEVATVDIPPGNLAMYYPEANVLVPRNLDSRSKTPAFKSILARIETATKS